MDVDRRVLLGVAASVAAASAAPSASAQQSAVRWPPAEQIKLWPKRPPNAPARLPTPQLIVNGPVNQRELWFTGVAEPVIGVFRPPNPMSRALAAPQPASS